VDSLTVAGMELRQPPAVSASSRRRHTGEHPKCGYPPQSTAVHRVQPGDRGLRSHDSGTDRPPTLAQRARATTVRHLFPTNASPGPPARLLPSLPATKAALQPDPCRKQILRYRSDNACAGEAATASLGHTAKPGNRRKSMSACRSSSPPVRCPCAKNAHSPSRRQSVRASRIVRRGKSDDGWIGTGWPRLWP